MARTRARLRDKPLYQPRPAAAPPSHKQRPWRTVVRILTLGLAGGERRGEGKPKAKEG